MYFKISAISQNHNIFCSGYVELLDMFVVPNYTLHVTSKSWLLFFKRRIALSNG